MKKIRIYTSSFEVYPYITFEKWRRIHNENGYKPTNLTDEQYEKLCSEERAIHFAIDKFQEEIKRFIDD